jgi:cell division protein FtsX
MTYRNNIDRAFTFKKMIFVIIITAVLPTSILSVLLNYSTVMTPYWDKNNIESKVYLIADRGDKLN